MSLDASEIERYARHLMLPEIGGAGQQRLKGARVLLIGVGGIGSPAALYLAAAGIGTIGLADDDTVSLSNLQRQILYGAHDIGQAKVASAVARLGQLNSNVAVVPHPVRIGLENADAILSTYDMVLDGSDNFATRFLVADRSAALSKALVSASVQRFSGQLTTFLPFASGADGMPNPGLRDLFPEPPPEGLVPSCAEVGILGVVTGVLGTLAAAEIIKLVTGIGTPLVGRLLLYDALDARFEEIRYRRKRTSAPRD